MQFRHREVRDRDAPAQRNSWNRYQDFFWKPFVIIRNKMKKENRVRVGQVCNKILFYDLLVSEKRKRTKLMNNFGTDSSTLLRGAVIAVVEEI